MSESLRECEVEGFDPNGDHVARGKWQCGNCTSPDGKLEWESRVEKKLIEAAEKHSVGTAKKFIDMEHRVFREAVAGEIEKHIRSH